MEKHMLQIYNKYVNNKIDILLIIILLKFFIL